MRIYEGSPRQDYEEVLRSIGAFLDQRGMREILFTEVNDGFLLQGLVLSEPGGHANWSDRQQLVKESFTFLDDDISRFMDEARRRRGTQTLPDYRPPGYYERALRVIGRYVDQQKPRDLFFLEQDGAFVMRLLMNTQAGPRHVLAEFTRDEIQMLIQQGPAYRAEPSPRGRRSS